MLLNVQKIVYSDKLIIAAFLICCFKLNRVSGFILTGRQTEQALCQSEIYCNGDLLHTVQMAKLYGDSKTFVDMKLRQDPEITLALFKEFMAEHSGTPKKEDLRQFVNENFEKSETDFPNWTPSDWKESPSFLNNIKDVNFRQFGVELNALWKILGRKICDDVAENPQLHSIIYVKNGVIVPGGRFHEFYYWDSYWIVRGLLYSEMYNTTKGMLENLLSIIDRYGFIPNGGRIYYLTRSDPPLLPKMIKTYVDMTNDTAFIGQALPLLEREFNFFMNNYMKDVNGYSLAVFGNQMDGPRPEAYYEDVTTSQHFETEEEKSEFYAEMNCGAESGMDFSSRWFIKNGSNEGELVDMKCRFIVPVDLNSILYWNAKTIAEFHLTNGNSKAAAEYEHKAQDLFMAIQAVLWNEEAGTWFDYDLINRKHREYFVPTNLYPLWLGAYNTANKSAIAKKVLDYIDSTGINKFPGGIPNSLMQSSEQWDYPNAWPPMQYVLIEGLLSLEDNKATELAFNWTVRWVRSNFIAYNESHAMFEKYSAEELGGHGGGGEYDVQMGFGWTNGVIIDFLAKYGNSLTLFD